MSTDRRLCGCAAHASLSVGSALNPPPGCPSCHRSDPFAETAVTTEERHGDACVSPLEIGPTDLQASGTASLCWLETKHEFEVCDFLLMICILKQVYVINVFDVDVT